MKAKRFLSTAEAALVLGVSETHVRRLCQGGKIPGAEKFGTVWMVPNPAAQKLAAQPAKTGRPRGRKNAIPQ